MRFTKKMQKLVAFLAAVSLLLTGAGFSEAAAAVTTGDAAKQLSGVQSVQGSGSEFVPSNGKEKENGLHPVSDGSVLTEITPSEGGLTVKELDSIGVSLKSGSGKAEELQVKAPYEPDEKVQVIVVLEEAPLLERNITAEEIAVGGEEAASAAATLVSVQNTVAAIIENRVLGGEELEVRYHYTITMNGMAVTVPYGKLEEIRRVPGVKDAFVAPQYVLDPKTVISGEMVGRTETWAAGYTGAGMKIAIIDTGLDLTHDSFAAAPKLTDSSLTKEKLAEVVTKLKAAASYSGLTASALYRSEKVPFAFNYVDENLRVDHKDGASDHGTHVAGIAAANKLSTVDVVGVAPDAQLYVMKVFGAAGGAYATDIIAALEDAIVLGADVINMSLGSPAGFSNDDERYLEVFETIAENTNIVLAVAAGNEYSSAWGNWWGTNLNLTTNPDNGIVGSPSTYSSSTSVASVNNLGELSLYFTFGTEKIAYLNGWIGEQNNSQPPVNNLFSKLAGNTYEVAFVENNGKTLEDFTNANVEGKIAIVSRGGGVNFTDMQAGAKAAGAVACIIYNNTTGQISPAMTDEKDDIPVIGITNAAAGQIRAIMKTGVNALTPAAEEGLLPSAGAAQMSEFSSWGSAPDLVLRPDVTAPGGNIYSTTDNNTYGYMSGTSMAAPHLAGIAALVLQYLKTEHPDLNPADMRYVADALIMSTAKPLVNTESPFKYQPYYSPRKQGAGLADAYAAVTSSAYLEVAGSDKPKASLGDDADRDGIYNVEFDVVNMSGKTLYYELATTVMTELGLSSKIPNPAYAASGSAIETGAAVNSPVLYFMYESGLEFELGSEVVCEAEGEGVFLLYDLNNDGKVNAADATAFTNMLSNVPAYLQIALDCDGDGDVDATDANIFASLIEDERFIPYLTSAQAVRVEPNSKADVSVEITLTEDAKDYMDTYFPNGIYVEGFVELLTLSEEETDLSLPYLAFYGDWTEPAVIDYGYYYDETDSFMGSQYFNVLFTEFGSTGGLLGINPYDETEPYDEKHNALSPDGDGYFDTVEDIYVSLLRGAKTLSFTYRDKATNAVLFEDAVEYARKSVYNSRYDQIVPYVYSWYSDPYGFTDNAGRLLPNNTEVELEIKATVDYDAHKSNNLHDTWTVPITVDLEKPTAVFDETSFTTQEVNGKTRNLLTLTLKDNHYIAAVAFLNASGTRVYAIYNVEDGEPGQSYEQTFDITGFGNEFTMAVCDYACNETYYEVIFEGENDPEIDKSLVYGYRVYCTDINNDSLYGWVGIDRSDPSELIALSSEATAEYSLTAAVYVDGYIVAVDAGNHLVVIKEGYWDERNEVATLDFAVRTMTYDYENKVLYAADRTNNRLVTIGLDGTVEEVGRYQVKDALFDFFPYYGPVGMAMAADGYIYALGMRSSSLYRFNPAEAEDGVVPVELLADTGLYLQYAQDVAYDPETNGLLWAYCPTDEMDAAHLLYISLEEGMNYMPATYGMLQGDAELVGLFLANDEDILDENEEVTAVTLNKKVTYVFSGGTVNLSATPYPWYSSNTKVTWSSDNEDVAAVTKNGKVLAFETGTAVITATTENGQSASCTVKVVEPTADLTGYRLVGNQGMGDWINFAADAPAYADSLGYAAHDFFAGEYYDGVVYAYDDSAKLYAIDPETLEERLIGAAGGGYYVFDMAFDYSTGYMYALAQDNDGSYLAVVDLSSGKIEIVGFLYDDGTREYSFVSMACGTDGTVYLLSYNGYIFSAEVDVENGIIELTKKSNTGLPTGGNIQSMCYDHNADAIYWAVITAQMGTALVYVAPETGEVLPIGAIAGGSEITAMYASLEEEIAPPYVPVASVELPDSKVMIAGAVDGSGLKVRPLNATAKDAEYTTSDESVVAIENGLLKAVEPGTAVITATLTDDGKTYTDTMTVTVKAASEGLYGWLLADLATMGGNFWISISDIDPTNGSTGLADGGDYRIYAGEYYDGTIYAYGVEEDPNSEYYHNIFIQVDAETMESVVLEGTDKYVLDMAFDYSTGAMYAVASDTDTITTTKLYYVDLNTGALVKAADLNIALYTLACSTDGTLYGVTADGDLYTVTANGSTSLIGNTGCAANQYQSMAFDHNTGSLYWAQLYVDFFAYVMDNGLKLVDTATAEVVDLGIIGPYGAQVTALHTIPSEPIEIPKTAIKEIAISGESLMERGGNQRLSVYALPLTATTELGEVTWKTSSPFVAMVDETGYVRALRSGNATITATAGGRTASFDIHVCSDSDVFYFFDGTKIATVPFLNANGMQYVDGAELNTGVVASAYAGGFVYGYDENGQFFKLSGSNWAKTEIGEPIDFNEKQVTALAYDETAKKLYASVVALNPETWWVEAVLYEVNMTTGALSRPVTLDPEEITAVYAMAFTKSGKLIIINDFNNSLYFANKTNGSVTEIGSGPLSMREKKAMAYDSVTDRVYLIDEDYWEGAIYLYMLDPNTGILTKVGEMTGLADVPNAGFVMRENKQTAPTTAPGGSTGGSTGGSSGGAVVVTPTPEPTVTPEPGEEVKPIPEGPVFVIEVTDEAGEVHAIEYQLTDKTEVEEWLAIAPELKLYVGGTTDTEGKVAVLPSAPVRLGEKKAEQGAVRTTLRFAVDGTDVVDVAEDGTVTAKAEGTAYVKTTIVFADNTTTEFTTKITVEKARVELTKAYATMKLGDKETFEIAVFGYDEKDIVWKTKVKDVAVVSKNTGKVKAAVTAKTAGKDYLYIYSGDTKLLTYTITVEEETPVVPEQTVITYVVKAGDTLGKIAREYNTTVTAIAERNNISNPNLINVGQVLEIPQ